MFKYELTSHPTFNIDNKVLDIIFDNVSSTILKSQNWTVNIIFLDDDRIQELNNVYRKKNSSTDVLSFHYYDDFSELNSKDIAAEIILSESHILSQGQEYGLGEEREFYKLIIHSLLHILWFDHENDKDYQEMKEFEKQIWQKVFEN